MQAKSLPPGQGRSGTNRPSLEADDRTKRTLVLIFRGRRSNQSWLFRTESRKQH